MDAAPCSPERVGGSEVQLIGETRLTPRQFDAPGPLTARLACRLAKPRPLWASGDRGYGGRANSEVSVDTVRDHALARLRRELCAVKIHRDLVGLEGHKIGDARDLGPGVLIGPCSAARVSNVVIAG
jgi:hypothetical protein